MGQFEKIVVLSVIGLIAVILVVSFSGTEKLPGEPGEGGLAVALGGGDAGLLGPQREGPRAIRGLSSGGDPSAPNPEDLDLRDPFDEGSEQLAWNDTPAREGSAIEREQLTLSAPGGAEPDLEPPAPTFVEGLPRGAALVTLRGLDDTWEADLKQYTCRRGDTLSSLARRFYGSAGLVGLLSQCNEGVTRPNEGDVLLIPVFDERDSVSGEPLDTPSRPAAGGAGAHVVGEGQNLWAIAKQHYGKGSDWNRIYEANRDRLSNPDALREGMTLIIP